MNNRDLTIAGLLAIGAVEILPSPTRKYRAFRDPLRNDASFFVGRSGALRYGERVTGSISLTDTRRHKALREIGSPAIHWQSPDAARAEFDRIVDGRLI